MSALRVDLDAPPEAYLDGYRRSFGYSLDAESFRWWFRRRVGGPAADVIVFWDGDVPAAGSAVGYRQLSGGELVGVMTGGWTDPAYRKRGLFRESIDCSREVAGARGAEALVGFIRAARASIPAAAAVSAVIVDAWLLEATGNVPEQPPRRAPSADDLREWFHANRLGTHFAYPGETFREQLRLDDPGTVVRDLGDRRWGICREGMLLAAVSERPWEPEEMAVTVERSGLSAYTTVPAVAAARSAEPAHVFVTPVGRPVPFGLREPLDFHAVDRA